ncbi:energy-coupling factor transport system ATP-binding protein [Knoellia remsis]|uniref:Energy-coupling factor transport system ATP-binding protein n=1 Tax=Knoellia remsis TaxID=407159 RepID=A0A2T0UEM1_9MICO|nr:ABC transporter ATP-binding protein [Knoellia remsis]PRY56298.1 energy-coupling factor transport system ATP-binding protein [Knoellia remsis]
MTGPAVVLDRVSVHFDDADAPVLRDVSVHVEEGELALVVGRTGSGKSTLLGTMTGIVPHFTGGTLSGRVLVHGRDTREHRPRDLADLVGVVGQDPLAGFVTDTVEEELAYGMEQLGLSAATMRKRVEETLDLLGIADLRGAALRELSGGQQQRVAIGSVLTTHPKVIVLDEPTSALDPTGAEDVLATITRLVHDLAVTVVVAEHRMERVLQYADTVIHVGTDGLVSQADPATAMATSTVAPPVVQLGRWAGWSPLPLSVRDARRRAASLRGLPHTSESLPHNHLDRLDAARSEAARPRATRSEAARPAWRTARNATEQSALVATDVAVTHGHVVAVAGVDLTLHPGEITALMGRNGAGKSSLLWALQGSGPMRSGSVRVTGDIDPRRLDAGQRRRHVGLVPQSAADLLYLDSVVAECRQADRESGRPAGTSRALLDRLAPGIPDDRHPRDLSEGQRLALVLAVQLTADPPVLLLDEPTRGLDYAGKAALRQALRALSDDGRCVVVSTHDVEFVAETADRVVVMAAGDVVADGTTREVVVASPAFAPQISKITSPQPWLTLDDVRAAVADTDGVVGTTDTDTVVATAGRDGLVGTAGRDGVDAGEDRP